MTVEVRETGPGLQFISGPGVTWINIEKPTPRDMEYLGEFYAFHPLDLEDCLSKRQLPKIDEYEDYLFIILHFPRFRKEIRLTLPSQVAIFLSRNYLVTVHEGDLKPLVELFQLCRANEAAREEYLGRDPGYLLYQILDKLVEYCFPILGKVLSNLEDLEDKVFDARVDASRDVAELRRDIAHQRRIIAPLRRVINALEVKAQRFTKEDISAYFGDVSDHINRVWETLEECKETIEIYKDVDFTLTQDRTNRILMVLTILMTIMLPFTVVSGIYGMNIALPFGTEQGSLAPFWSLFSLMLLFAGAMLFFFRRRGWI